MNIQEAETYFRETLRQQPYLFTTFANIIDKMRTGRILIAHWSLSRFNRRHDIDPIPGNQQLRIVEHLPRAALAEVIAQLCGEKPEEDDW